MKNWRRVFSKDEKLISDFKRYKTDNGVDLPNLAEFTGDKFPKEKGDPAKVELQAYKAGNKEYGSDKKRENKSKGNSALMAEDAKRQDVDSQTKADSKLVRPSYATRRKAFIEPGERSVKCPYCGHVDDEVSFLDPTLGDNIYKCPDCDSVFDRDSDSLSILNGEEDVFSSKKIAANNLRCPGCGHEGSEREFITPNAPASTLGRTCPKCGRFFPREEGDPVNFSEYPGLEEAKTRYRNEGGGSMRQTPPRFTGKRSWRKVLSDVSFKNKPDGTVQIDVSSHPNAPLAQNPNTGQPAPPSPEQVQQKEQQTGQSAEASLRKSAVEVGDEVQHINSGLRGIVRSKEGTELNVYTSEGSQAIWDENEVNFVGSVPAKAADKSSSREWSIMKKGTLELKGKECVKNAGIRIEKDGQVIESYSVAKEGHSWREVISEGIWAAKLEERIK